MGRRRVQNSDAMLRLSAGAGTLPVLDQATMAGKDTESCAIEAPTESGQFCQNSDKFCIFCDAHDARGTA